MVFWKDGDYNARGGYFIRNNLKEFFKKLCNTSELNYAYWIEVKNQINQL